MDTQSTAATGTKMMNKTWLRWLLIVLLASTILLTIIYRDSFDIDQLNQWITNAGWAAPIFFVLLYALATTLMVPGLALTLAGGALFGPIWGTVFNLTGATIGASVAFLIARYLGADWVQKKMTGKSKKLIDGVEEEGWRFVAFTRLVPLFPFSLLNYALGFTRIPFLHYVIASFVFMVPGAFAYTWLGYTGKEALADGNSLIQNGLIAFALLATLSFVPRLVKRLRK